MDNQQEKAITVSPEIWQQFKDAVDIGQPVGHQPDYDRLVRIMLEQAICEYIALKQKIRASRKK